MEAVFGEHEGDTTNEKALPGFLVHDLSINFCASKKG